MMAWNISTREGRFIGPWKRRIEEEGECWLKPEAKSEAAGLVMLPLAPWVKIRDGGAGVVMLEEEERVGLEGEGKSWHVVSLLFESGKGMVNVGWMGGLFEDGGGGDLEGSLPFEFVVVGLEVQ